MTSHIKISSMIAFKEFHCEMLLTNDVFEVPSKKTNLFSFEKKHIKDKFYSVARRKYF